MHMQIIETTAAERVTFANVYQYYLYDFTEFIPMSLDEEGRFPDDDLEGYWEKHWKYAFLLRVDGEIGGFAMVEERRHAAGDEDVTEIAEFFVMRQFRGKGAGEFLAHALFDRFPGRWRVRQVEENKPALAFWRKVIGRYTNNDFEDTRWQHGTRTGTVQYFISGKQG